VVIVPLPRSDTGGRGLRPYGSFTARPLVRAVGCASSRLDSAAVSAEEVDEYLRALEEPQRSTLQALRSTILEIVPEAEQVISYGVPLSAYAVRRSPAWLRLRVT
jgi:hypothetical protein